MILDNKGAILPVTIVAMLIMLIIGLVCLQIFSSQNILDTYDQIKQRTFYSAEGSVEMVRGFIDYSVNAHLVGGSDNHEGGAGYLFSRTKNTNWYPLETVGDCTAFATTKVFDGTMYPNINCRAYCARISTKDELKDLRNNKKVIFPGVTEDNVVSDRDHCAYKIVAIASSTHKTNLGTNLIVSTLTYYFCTEMVNNGTVDNPIIEHKKYFVCWRRD